MFPSKLNLMLAFLLVMRIEQRGDAQSSTEPRVVAYVGKRHFILGTDHPGWPKCSRTGSCSLDDFLLDEFEKWNK